MRLLVAFVVLLALATSARAQTITVFAAASLKNAFDAIGEAFTQETGVTVVFSYAGTSVLARQIEHGAPADIFASANDAWTTYLAERDALVAGSTLAFAGNAMAVVAPAGAVERLDIARLDNWLQQLGGDGRIAVALTNAVPAGMYARQALESLALWDDLQPRLAQTDNVRAALFLVARGEAPLGIVYATDSLAEPGVETVAGISPSLHTPITYTASRIAGPGMSNAEQFLTFLRQPTAQGILQGHGFASVGRGGT